ncbi:MAG: SPFH domain-containing protein [Pseudomonadota bacterium]
MHLHVPVNPLYNWFLFDVREKSHKETANVPSQDQLQTRLDVSVQYRLVKEMAPQILQGTGAAEDAVRVHLVPKLRSVLREQGKTIKRAEDFFQEQTQNMLQVA